MLFVIIPFGLILPFLILAGAGARWLLTALAAIILGVIALIVATTADWFTWSMLSAIIFGRLAWDFRKWRKTQPHVVGG